MHACHVEMSPFGHFGCDVFHIGSACVEINSANYISKYISYFSKKIGILNVVSFKIYDKPNNFDFDIANFTFLDGDIPRDSSYDVYISHFIRFARMFSHLAEFNARKKLRQPNFFNRGVGIINI